MSEQVAITRRLPLYMGTKCNCRCKFCYYYDLVDKDNKPFEEIKAELIKYRKNKIDSVDITGGEPTLHRDLIKTIETVTAMGFLDTHVITNGIALKNERYLDQVIQAGTRFFTLSVHGPTAEIHDRLTGRPGSFADMMKTIDNLNRRKFYYSINFVINKINYQSLQAFAEFVKETCSSCMAVTFLVMNPMLDGRLNFDEYMVRYSDMEPYLGESIKALDAAGKRVSWKFMPLCIGRHNLQHTDSILTLFFSPFDWNYVSQVRINYGFFLYFFMMMKNFTNFTLKQLSNIQLRVLKHLSLLAECFNPVFTKIEQCNDCKFFYVCDGISKVSDVVPHRRL